MRLVVRRPSLLALPADELALTPPLLLVARRCVWDLTTPERRGWHVSNGCFMPFSTPHYCDRWWFQRPGQRELEEEAREADDDDGAGALGEDLGIDART